MNFLALLLGLAVERLLTALFRLREFHWLDPLFDRFYGAFKNDQSAINIIAVWGFLMCLLAPVLLVVISLENRFAHIPLFLFSVFVLLFCLGPRDLGEEVSDYMQAIDDENTSELRQLAGEILKRETLLKDGAPDIEKAIYAQANNRIFGVVFWFALMGPVGAWMFRVIDLMRHRVLFHPDSESSHRSDDLLQAVLIWHRVLAWVPAQLLMIGYALAGNFEKAVSAWRKHQQDSATPTDDQLLASVGSGAADQSEESDVAARAQVAIDLVVRTLWFIWCPVLALLTLYGWLI
ncbi:MAG: regulatory signaling modulator protein AmpE [Gammaproteobacteria bacterium]